MQQTSSKGIEKNHEKCNEKTAEMFRKVMESIQDLVEANKLERANIVLKQLFKVESLTLDVESYVLVEGNPTVVKIPSFFTIHSKTQKSLRVFFIHKFWKNLS